MKDSIHALTGRDLRELERYRAQIGELPSPMTKMPTVDEALRLLLELGAPSRLVTHGLLVLEAANELLDVLQDQGVVLDEALVRAGAVLHDVGKTLHPNELGGPGASHEEAGRALLGARHANPILARACVTHAHWADHDCSLEELVVALADTLWKGVRRQTLEERIIDEVARRSSGDRWSVFVPLDECFERIANDGPARLARSILDG